jgi:hypothetical protein
LKRFTVLVTFLLSLLQADINLYGGLSRAGFTPGIAYAGYWSDNFGIEIGGNYALGASTTNVSYESYSGNGLLTFRFRPFKHQLFVLKGGGSYRTATTNYTNFNTTVVSKETLYYNYGFDYIYVIPEVGKIGLSYFADTFGLVYGVEF